MQKIHLNLGVLYRTVIILLNDRNNLHNISNNLNCKMRVLRKFFVNLQKKGEQPTKCAKIAIANQVVELNHNI